MASAVACLSLSLSSILIAPPLLSFASFSSSLSPRLKGSLSEIGFGSIDDNGCHLLCLPGGGVALLSLGGIRGEASYWSMSSMFSLKATLRPSGLGEVEGGGGL